MRDLVSDWACRVHLVDADPDQGALLQPADVAAAEAAHPGVATTTIRGAGHSLHRDEPEAVAELLAAALGA